MKIHLITIGQRMPNWVEDGCSEYLKRLPADYELIIKALPSEKRAKNANTETLMNKESERLLSACPANTTRIALDRKGKMLSTQELAETIQRYHDESQDIALLIGGPEGISEDILNKMDQLWSLSKLTLPHPLVRLLISEQIYRAFSILSNHPYHR